MARTQSPNYDDRQKAILHEAAQLFARHGFLGASISNLAAACKTSKSLVYHYFPSKEDVLYGVMSAHLDDLRAILEVVMQTPELSPEQRLRKLTRDFVAIYVGAAASHKVLLNELDNLPHENRAVIVAHQREIIDQVGTLLIAIRPELCGAADLQRPISMLFFGMINWTHTWYDPAGPVSPDQLAMLANDLLLAGLERVALTN